MSKTNKAIAALSVVASLGVAAAPMSAFATGYLNPRGHSDKLNVTIEEICAFGYTSGTTVVVHAGYHIDGTYDTYTGGAIAGSSASTQADTPETGIDAGKGWGNWMSDGVDGDSDATNNYSGTGDVAPTDLANSTVNQGTVISTYDYDTVTTTDDTYTEVFDTAYGIMENNTYNSDFAQTQLNIVCNNENGYTLTAIPENMTNVNGTGTGVITAGAYSTTKTSGSLPSGWSYQLAATTRDSSHGTSDWAAQTNTNTLTQDAQTWSDTAATTQDQLIALTSNKGVATPSLGDSFTVTYGVSISATLPAGTYEGSIRYILAQI